MSADELTKALGLIDLYRDEFMRIKALDVNGEVNGICDRAVKDIERNFSVIAELSSTRELLTKQNQYYEDMRESRDNVITTAIARERVLVQKLHEKDRQLGSLEQQLCNFQEEIDRLRGDARRFHWLCDDHSSAQVRSKRGVVEDLADLRADHARVLGLVQETVEFFESNFENAGLELCGLMGGKEITYTGQRLNELIEQLAASLPAQPAQGGV